jgi:benzoyl-CoA reductase/2-hydroxyglutaryl-CoA dehydratase subunit BcrC/BadD/HgdB
MYELYDLVVFKKKPIPLFYMTVPHILSEEAFNWFNQEVKELKSEIEQKYEVNISKESLVNSIEIYKENRKLMREIDKYRKRNPSMLSGTDFLRISLSNTSVPKEVANENIKEILDNLSISDISIKGNKRILIAGSAIDSPNFINLVEEAGANVVSDFMCFGDRNLKNDIPLNIEDPLKSISSRLYYKVSCPRIMNDHENRLKLLLKEIKEAEIDGVILQRINNCDLHGCDNMLFEHELKNLNIPILNIDREVFLEDKIRLRTRIEAFLEII